MEEAGREKDISVAVEDLGAATKDTVNISAKPTRRYPLLSWTTILALIALVGVYIFSVSFKQNGMLLGLMQTNMIEKQREKLCQDPSIPVTEIPYVHYPTPDTYSRKECACTPVRFFAILSMQRSGSGWIETLLNSHENISSNGEIFSIKERRSNITSITKTLDKLYNLDWLSSAAKNECTAAVGLKWMLNQGLMKHHKEIAEYFNQRGVSAIFLLRRNLLQRYVSVLANAHDSATKQLNGTHKSHVHSKHEAEVLAQFKPEINTTSLIADLKKFDKLAADALVNFKTTRHIILYYEDVVSNKTKLMDVLDFMRLPKRKLSSRHVKIHTKLLRDHIYNWADVNKTLMGTQYESFLND
ncbi:nodulation protein H-like [Oryza brachyantha]|uniref:Sulfotransferase n=1 Tax=Oryza brachyantha TaxID=4533 RepID=J3L4R3_ORYBR|nr:nodulation protein H-like [Oryza brachyantha]XP_015697855.1 nodulation protein H-like [Oryza brachyantha]XP_040377655.1 nodulation protein H-like [Oryza brachyantha]